jgi:SAM-dependent methyltransferase
MCRRERLEADLDIYLLAVRIVQTIRKDGLPTAFRKAFVHLRRGRTTDDFDLRNGTDTSGIEPLWRFMIHSPNARFGVRYEPTDEHALVDAINFLHEDLQTLTFIDLGCGKGRPLLVAAKLGFKEVIGVEFARELVEIARENLAKMQIANAVVMHTDAADFHFPSSPMIVYIYNSFSQNVMHKVVANLRESDSKRLYVIYRAAECAEVFDSSGFLGRLGSPPARRDIQIWGRLNEN